MDTEHKVKFNGLDHLRALAIVLVFLFHYFFLSGGEPDWLPEFARLGWTGVDLFFALSGFLISSQLFAKVKQGQNVSLKQFYIKRFFRIIPVYLVVLGIYFCVPFFREKEHLPHLWKFLTFTQNLDLNLKDFGTFSHAWSLCVEEHFYILFPIILISILSTSYYKKSYWLLVALFLFGFIIRMYSFNHLYMPHIEAENAKMLWYKFVYYPTYNRIDGLLVGVSIAALFQFAPSTWSKISRYGNLLIGLSLFVLTGVYFLCYDQMTYYSSVFGFPLIACGFGLLVMGALSPSSFLYKWNSKITTHIATLSYSLYLSHKGIIHITHQLLDKYSFDNNFLLLISMLTCVGFAIFLNRTIEKPFMKIRNQILCNSN